MATIEDKIMDYARLHRDFHQDALAMTAAEEEWDCQIETVFRTLRKLGEDKKLEHLGKGYWKLKRAQDDKSEALTKWFT